MSEQRASSSSETECRCFAKVSNQNIAHLANSLRCLSKLSSVLSQYEAVLHVHGRGDVRLKKDMHGSDRSCERWVTRWESEAQLGPLYKQLPAAVRQVMETECKSPIKGGSNVLDFWLGLGAHLKYDFVKHGNAYLCNHNGHEIICHLFQIASMVKPGSPAEGWDEKLSGYPWSGWVLDLRVLVDEGKHVEGARALVSFGQTLHPHVSNLQPACLQ